MPGGCTNPMLHRYVLGTTLDHPTPVLCRCPLSGSTAAGSLADARLRRTGVRPPHRRRVRLAPKRVFCYKRVTCFILALSGTLLPGCSPFGIQLSHRCAIQNRFRPRILTSSLSHDLSGAQVHFPLIPIYPVPGSFPVPTPMPPRPGPVRPPTFLRPLSLNDLSSPTPTSLPELPPAPPTATQVTPLTAPTRHSRPPNAL